MNIELNGEKINEPFCSCVKCILRRNRNGNRNTKYPYNKHLTSTYKEAHGPKGVGLSPQFFNRSIRNGFENSHKEHLTAGLISTMKFDYKPFLVKLDSKPENQVLEQTPFYGRSTYNANFPSWGGASSGNGPKIKLPLISVPFRGNSNYDENFQRFEDDTYRFLSPNFKQKASLEFRGKVLNDSNCKESFRPVDRQKADYVGFERPRKMDREKTVIIPAEYPKADGFNSTYGDNFMDRVDKECKLSMFFKKNGLKNLEL